MTIISVTFMHEDDSGVSSGKDAQCRRDEKLLRESSEDPWVINSGSQGDNFMTCL